MLAGLDELDKVCWAATPGHVIFFAVIGLSGRINSAIAT
jgi:hypothetical protein